MQLSTNVNIDIKKIKIDIKLTRAAALSEGSKPLLYAAALANI